jgi:transposase
LKRHRHKHAKHKPAARPPQALPSNVADLQEMVIALQHEVAQLRRMLFGRRSERLLPDDPAQGFLFGRIGPQAEAPASPEESASSPDETSEDDEEPAPRRRTRHHGRRPLPAHLMRCVHDIHPAQEDLICPSCGHAKTIFGQDVTEELEMIPAKYFVNRYVRHKCACPLWVRCSRSRPPESALGRALADDRQQVFEHLPLYRIQELYRRLGPNFRLDALRLGGSCGRSGCPIVGRRRWCSLP